MNDRQGFVLARHVRKKIHNFVIAQLQSDFKCFSNVCFHCFGSDYVVAKQYINNLSAEKFSRKFVCQEIQVR